MAPSLPPSSRHNLPSTYPVDSARAHMLWWAAGEPEGTSSRLPEDPCRVPGAFCFGGRLPAIPHGVPVAERVSVSSVRTCGGLSGGGPGAVAVWRVSLPGLGHGGEGGALFAPGPARGCSGGRTCV